MTLNELAQQINDNARAKGFWDADRNMGEMLMLAVSELAEALEEHRAGMPAEYFQLNGSRVYPVTDGSGADWTTDSRGGSFEKSAIRMCASELERLLDQIESDVKGGER